MRSEKIELPNFIIASLYKDCLVELESTKEEAANITTDNLSPAVEEVAINYIHAIQYLGQNKKSTAVIVNDSDADVINDIDPGFSKKHFKSV